LSCFQQDFVTRFLTFFHLDTGVSSETAGPSKRRWKRPVSTKPVGKAGGGDGSLSRVTGCSIPSGSACNSVNSGGSGVVRRRLYGQHSKVVSPDLRR
jgi:hypothetical protein